MRNCKTCEGQSLVEEQKFKLVSKIGWRVESRERNWTERIYRSWNSHLQLSTFPELRITAGRKLEKQM